MHRRVYRLAGCTALLGMVACTAIAGLDGDFEEAAPDGGGSSTSSGGTDSGAKDGTTPADGQTLTDDAQGSKDVQTEDVFDAGIDTGPQVEIDTIPPLSTVEADSNCPAINDPLYFCWDFKGTSDVAPGFSWPQTDYANGGVIDVNGGADNDPRRAMVATVDAATGRAALWRDLTVDHPYAQGKAIVMSFLFRVESANTAAAIAALRLGAAKDQYGLMFLPDGCGAGHPCLVDTLGTPLKISAFNVNTWYRGAIRLLHAADDKWLPSITVGDKEVAKRAAPMHTGDPRPVGLGVGILKAMSPSGIGTVRIDDIRISELVP